MKILHYTFVSLRMFLSSRSGEATRNLFVFLSDSEESLKISHYVRNDTLATSLKCVYLCANCIGVILR